MGIDHNYDVRVRFPQMIQHGFQVVPLHFISIFGLCAGGANGAVHQQKGGVFPVLVFRTFALPLYLMGGGGGNFRSGALPGGLFGSCLRE